MSPRLADTIAMYGTGLALWAVGLALAGHRPPRSLAAALVALESACVLQALLDGVGLLGGHRPASPATHIAYLATSVAILPMMLSVRARDAPSVRTDTVVVALGALAVAIVALRLDATWAPARG